MLNKAIWATLFFAATFQASPLPDVSSSPSARLMAHGTGQVMSGQHSAGQLFTSEAAHPAVLVPDVTSLSGSAALAPVSLPLEAWQLIMACLAMAAFALITILRRLHRHQLQESSLR